MRAADGRGVVGAPPEGAIPERGPDAVVAALRERVEEALRQLLRRELSDAPPEVAEPIRYAVLGSGKRVRPLLLLAAREAAGGNGSRAPGAAALACSVELVHTYSLIHDDLPCMDDDVLRRGRPTLHVRYGSGPAVLAGAALMPLAARTVWRSGEELGLSVRDRRRLLTTLAAASGGSGMVGGQLGDLRAEGRRISREELEEIHRRKTAALMVASIRMGGIAGGADPELLERLERLGGQLGLAFQAVDDILDVTGSDRQLGKKSGRDRALGKATYPSVLGLEEAGRVSRELAARARRELSGIRDDRALRAIIDYVIQRTR